METLIENGVETLHHYTPLHYLPFIARDALLRTKFSLSEAGFQESHLRSKSAAQDIRRGFGDCLFLTIDQAPPILRAKLSAGFPHIDIRIPVSALADTAFALCRFNVAMTRQLRRNGSPGWPESSSNGRYYGDRQVPTAVSRDDQAALLSAHLGISMIEVILEQDLPLPLDTEIVVFHEQDLSVANDVLATIGSTFSVRNSFGTYDYQPNTTHTEEVRKFIDAALDDPLWKGNGLEFDRI